MDFFFLSLSFFWKKKHLNHKTTGAHYKNSENTKKCKAKYLHPPTPSHNNLCVETQDYIKMCYKKYMIDVHQLILKTT